MDWQRAIYTLIGLLIGVIFHEFMHAKIADMLGDHTARNAGRVTLNPIPHMDPIGSIALPIILSLITLGNFTFGYAKPVPINPFFLKKPRRDELIISLAGPLTNFAIAFIFAIIGFLLIQVAGIGIAGLYLFLLYASGINIFLAIFNLIPIPPLDGSHVLEYFLSPKNREIYDRITPYGFVIILGIFALERMFGVDIFAPFMNPIMNLIGKIMLGY